MHSHRLKLARALEHLYALESAVQMWSQRETWAIVRECEIKTHKHTISIRLFESPDPVRIPLLIGDCVHNMRQGLDHLAYQLAVVVHGSDPPPNEDSTAFPIHSTPTIFEGKIGGQVGAPTKMPDGLYTALEACQSYKGRAGKLLGALHQLDNTDKHRFPPVVVGIGEVPGFHFANAAFSHLAGPRVGPLKEGTPIIEYIPLTDDADVHMNFDVSPSIAFDERSPVAAGQMVWPFLGEIHTMIKEWVFPKLERFL